MIIQGLVLMTIITVKLILMVERFAIFTQKVVPQIARLPNVVWMAIA
jgi:hypothetical protein